MPQVVVIGIGWLVFLACSTLHEVRRPARRCRPDRLFVSLVTPDDSSWLTAFDPRHRDRLDHANTSGVGAITWVAREGEEPQRYRSKLPQDLMNSRLVPATMHDGWRASG